MRHVAWARVAVIAAVVYILVGHPLFLLPQLLIKAASRRRVVAAI